ncbi:hypothetical protein [Streptomyces californicus]|uniref:hypothetical protein n=1 Tax=Streptomyces californicus TaxID=67351 RepID=UPI0033DA4EA9
MGAVAALADFLNRRWAEEAQEAKLFHELACTVLAEGLPETCDCPCPARIYERVAVDRRILRGCEERITKEQQELCWSIDSTLAFTTMKVLALPCELHSTYQYSWYP